MPDRLTFKHAFSFRLAAKMVILIWRLQVDDAFDLPKVFFVNLKVLR